MITAQVSATTSVAPIIERSVTIPDTRHPPARCSASKSVWLVVDQRLGDAFDTLGKLATHPVVVTTPNSLPLRAPAIRRLMSDHQPRRVLDGLVRRDGHRVEGQRRGDLGRLQVALIRADIAMGHDADQLLAVENRKPAERAELAALNPRDGGLQSVAAEIARDCSPSIEI